MGLACATSLDGTFFKAVFFSKKQFPLVEWFCIKAVSPLFMASTAVSMVHGIRIITGISGLT
jgi:hypothetical protein